MNYRELQLRQLIKRDYVPKSLHQQEKGQLTAQHQQEKKKWEQAVKELQKARAQDLIDKLQQDLGINFLLDYQNIVDKLAGRTVEQLLNEEEQKEQVWEQEKNQATQHIQQLNQQIKGLTILAEKRKEDLDQEKQALINLAKQKIANKKEAGELLKQLKERWQRDKNDWNQERENLAVNKQALEKRVNIRLNDNRLLKEQLTNKDQQISQLKTTQENLQRGITDLQNQNKELIKENEEIGKGKFNEQLRQINLLFDPSATNYEVIDFNGLYELLKNVAERERERERAIWLT